MQMLKVQIPREFAVKLLTQAMVFIQLDNFLLRQIKIGPSALNGGIGGKEDLAALVDGSPPDTHDLDENKILPVMLLAFANCRHGYLFAETEV